MESNLLLRRLRYALSMRNRDVQDIMALGGLKISDEKVRALLQREGDPEFALATVEDLSAFLDGLIVRQRGRREPTPGQEPPPPIVAGMERGVTADMAFALTAK